jgi:hypothetical protein
MTACIPVVRTERKFAYKQRSIILVCSSSGRGGEIRDEACSSVGRKRVEGRSSSAGDS